MMAWRGQNCVGRSFDFGMLSRVTMLATQSVTSGVQTAAMVTGMAVAGGAQNIMQGRAAGGGLRSLSGLGIMAGSGMGHDLGGAMPGIAQGSGFGGTSMAGGMGDMGKGMEKEFGSKGAGGRLGGITGFLGKHLGVSPASGQTATDTAAKDGATSGDSDAGSEPPDGGDPGGPGE